MENEARYGGLMDMYFFRDILIVIASILFISLILFNFMSYFLDNYYKQTDNYYKQTIEFCDDKFGKDNWEFKEKERESFREKIYIGEIWECKKIEKFK